MLRAVSIFLAGNENSEYLNEIPNLNERDFWQTRTIFNRLPLLKLRSQRWEQWTKIVKKFGLNLTEAKSPHSFRVTSLLRREVLNWRKIPPIPTLTPDVVSSGVKSVKPFSNRGFFWQMEKILAKQWYLIFNYLVF